MCVWDRRLPCGRRVLFCAEAAGTATEVFHALIVRGACPPHECRAVGVGTGEAEGRARGAGLRPPTYSRAGADVSSLRRPARRRRAPAQLGPFHEVTVIVGGHSRHGRYAADADHAHISWGGMHSPPHVPGACTRGGGPLGHGADPLLLMPGGRTTCRTSVHVPPAGAWGLTPRPPGSGRKRAVSTS